jgi:hypothetical protein
MKSILNRFRSLPLADKCVVVTEILALLLLPLIIGMERAKAETTPPSAGGHAMYQPEGSAPSSHTEICILTA